MFRLGVEVCKKFALSHVHKSKVHRQTEGTLKLFRSDTFTDSIRTTSFFNKLSSESIWRSCVSVSSAGKKKGRGKGTNRVVLAALRSGQKSLQSPKVVFPGFNAAVLQSHEVMPISKVESSENTDTPLRQPERKIKRERIHPLLRGWTSKSLCGRLLDPPIMNDCEVQGIDTMCVETKFLRKMTSKMGRASTVRCIVIAGNRNGLLGVGRASAPDLKAAMKKAQKRSIKQLVHYKLQESHTINHDFTSRFGGVRLYAFKKPKGYGLVCHRCIVECCKLIGIQDLYVKKEGSSNTTSILKAFLLGLMEQKTYQEIADETKCHVVEMKNDRFFYPMVLASPSEPAESKREHLLFREYVMGGRLPYIKMKKRETWETKAKPYARYLKKVHYRRNHPEVRRALKVHFGELRSHLTDLYPECKPVVVKKGESSAELD